MAVFPENAIRTKTNHKVEDGSFVTTIPITNTESVLYQDGDNPVFLDTKLDDIDSKLTPDAEPNQLAFSTLTLNNNGTTSKIPADSKTCDLKLSAGDNVTLTKGTGSCELTISAKDTTYGTATTSNSGLMSAASLVKLNSIADNAEVNQNAFSSIDVVNGSTTSNIASDSKTDKLTIAAGTNISLNADATNDKITINNTYSYTHPTYSATPGTDSDENPNHGGTFTVLKSLTAENGHLTGYKTVTIKLPNAYSHPTHTAYTSNLYKVTVDNLGHVTGATAVTKSDITGYGIPDTSSVLTKTNTTSFTPSADYQPATKKYVDDAETDAINAAKTYADSLLASNDAMIFKGTLGTGGTITALPATHNAGWTYRVITAGTYANIKCEVGDLIICIKDGRASANSDWTVAQTNIDGAVTGPTSATSGNVAIFDGVSGKLIKDSGKTIPTNLSELANDAGFIKAADIPEGAAASSTVPKMNGSANAGTEMAFARGDHVHPTDTSRAASDHTHGNITNAGEITSSAVTPASGDTIAIIDSSNSSKLSKGMSIGTSTTTYLRNDGTWGTPAGTYSHPTYTVGGTTSTASPAHGETFTTIGGITTNNLGHVTSIETKTVTMPGVVHPTISKSTDSTSTASPAHGETFTAVDSVTRDDNGHVTKINTKTVTLPGQYSHPTHTAKSSGLYKITVDSLGHVSAATAVAKADITGLGIPSSDTNTTYTFAGSASSTNGNAKLNLTAGGSGSGTQSITIKGTGKTSVTTDSDGVFTINTPDQSQNVFSTVAITNGTSTSNIAADSTTDTLTLVAGNNVTLTADTTNDKVTIGVSGTIPVGNLPVGTSSTQVSAGNHNHDGVYLKAHPTISTSTDSTSTASPAHGETFTTVDSVTRDGNGHVTKINTKTVTLPAAPASYTHPTYTVGSTTSTASPDHGKTFTAIGGVTTNNLGHVTSIDTKTITLPAQYSHPTHTAKSSGLYKITVNNLGHVTEATAVTKADITGLGIPGSDTVYTHPSDGGEGGVASGSAGQLSHGGTFSIPSITFNAAGHIVSTDSTTCSLPNSTQHNITLSGDITGSASTNTSGDITISTSLAKTFTANRLMYTSSSGALSAFSAPSTSNAVLRQSSSGAPVWDTTTPIIQVVSSLPSSPTSGVLYVVPAQSLNTTSAYVLGSSAPSDTTKIWIDTANYNVPKVYNGSSWITLGSVWS